MYIQLEQESALQQKTKILPSNRQILFPFLSQHIAIRISSRRHFLFFFFFLLANLPPYLTARFTRSLQPVLQRFHFKYSSKFLFFLKLNALSDLGAVLRDRTPIRNTAAI